MFSMFFYPHIKPLGIQSSSENGTLQETNFAKNK